MVSSFPSLSSAARKQRVRSSAYAAAATTLLVERTGRRARGGLYPAPEETLTKRALVCAIVPLVRPRSDGTGRLGRAEYREAAGGGAPGRQQRALCLCAWQQCSRHWLFQPSHRLL